MKYLPALFVVTVLLTSAFGVVFNPVQADTLEWTWTAPTERNDGTSFDMLTEGAGYQYMFNGEIQIDADGAPLLLSPGANGLEKTFPAGDVCLQLATQDLQGRLSTSFTEAVNNATQTACHNVKAPPGMPSNITVNIKVE